MVFAKQRRLRNYSTEFYSSYTNLTITVDADVSLLSEAVSEPAIQGKVGYRARGTNSEFRVDARQDLNMPDLQPG